MMESCIRAVLDRACSEGYECEVYGEAARAFQVEMHLGKLESVDSSRDAGIAIRLVHEGRVGHSFTSDLSPAGLDGAVGEAVENASNSTPMDEDVLAGDEGGAVRGGLYPKLPPEGRNGEKIDGVAAMEEACLDADRTVVNTENARYSEVSAEIFVASTRGFFRSERRGACSCSIQAVARGGEEVRSGWYYAQGLEPEDLDFAAVGREAAARAARLLGSGRIETKRCDVVIDGMAVIGFLGLLERALSGEMVAKGTSALAGKLGAQIAPAWVTVVDDPFLDRGCYNAGFDAEGMPTAPSVLVDSGTLGGYLHNAYSARKLDVPRSSNAVRETYKSIPVPGPTNLILAAGEKDLSGMIEECGEGIYVIDIMGMHTADHISGDFSLGISGFLIRSGEVGSPISEMTLSGNILGLLGSIRGIGGETVFIGQYGTPAILVEGMSVSGK